MMGGVCRFLYGDLRDGSGPWVPASAGMTEG